MEQTIKPTLEISEALRESTDKILQFKGRSRRSEFWWTMAVVYFVNLVFPPIGFVLSIATIPLTFRRLHDTGRSGWWWGFGFILRLVLYGNIIYDFIRFFPNGINDADVKMLLIKYLAIVLVLLLYSLVLMIMLCVDSEPYANKYGESPKYVGYDRRR
ncbi:MAG: DUF805 domain-containing protein [Prevotella sp.]|nr:DUF805 domain-containing protein [Prevotella sp.]